MVSQTLVEQLSAIISPILDSMAIELVDLEYKHEGREWFLRIFIDKEGGVTLDDCEKVSREAGVVLEVEDLIHTAYRLEVSSPGIDRPLKKAADYERFTGHLIKVKTLEKLDPDQRGYTRKTFIGTLLGIENGRISLQQTDKKGGIVEFALDEIAKANLEFEF